MLCSEGLAALKLAIDTKLSESWQEHKLFCPQCKAAAPITVQIVQILEHEGIIGISQLL